MLETFHLMMKYLMHKSFKTRKKHVFCWDSPGKTLTGNFFIAAATVFSKKYKHQKQKI